MLRSCDPVLSDADSPWNCSTAQTIVREYHWKPERKTVPPLPGQKGIAGGVKYKVSLDSSHHR